MYCRNCGEELSGNKNSFCPNCGTKLGDAVQLGMVDFEVIDDKVESIELGMSRFEIKGSSASIDIPNILQKLTKSFGTIKELLKLWNACSENFSSLDIDLYLAVKYKYKDGTKLLLIDKQEQWDEWCEIMSELKTNFDEALYLLSILKPKLFDNSEKKIAYKNARNTYGEYASEHNAIMGIITEHDEIKILDNDN